MQIRCKSWSWILMNLIAKKLSNSLFQKEQNLQGQVHKSNYAHWQGPKRMDTVKIVHAIETTPKRALHLSRSYFILHTGRSKNCQPVIVSLSHASYSGNSLTHSSWELVFKSLLSELCVIQQSFNVKSHLGTKKLLLVIRNSVLSGYVLRSCHCTGFIYLKYPS